MQAFMCTPVCLQREHTAPAFLHYGDTGTSYTSMNEWLHMPGKTVPASKPVVRTLSDWRELPTHEQMTRAAEGEEELEEEEMYPNLPRPRGPEDNYKRVYDNLTHQIAYRWPNPGEPRAREGCIGGTWRHIKEVLGHGGSRFVFVDGLVSVYDNQKFTEKLQAQLPYRPHIKPLYAPMKSEGKTTPRGSFSNLPVLPGVPASSVTRDPDMQRKLKLQERYPTGRRGFYSYK